MMIRVQEQDNIANGYLNSNVSSIGIQQLVLMMMIANVQDSKQVVPWSCHISTNFLLPTTRMA
jgi:hypothetical protein